jgi:predicted transcriptional regulator
MKIDCEALRRAREKKLLTLTELAKLAEVSHTTVANAEKGKKVSVRCLRKIIEALGHAPDDNPFVSQEEE